MGQHALMAMGLVAVLAVVICLVVLGPDFIDVPRGIDAGQGDSA